MSRITVTTDLKSVEHLNAEAIAVRRAAGEITLVCTDAKISASARKYACESVAHKLAAEQLGYPLTTEALVDGLQRVSVPRERAHALAERLAVAGIVRAEREQLADSTAAEVITALLNRPGGHVHALVRPTNAAPPPAPTPEPVGPPRHENPSAEGRPPSLAQLDEEGTS